MRILPQHPSHPTIPSKFLRECCFHCDPICIFLNERSIDASTYLDSVALENIVSSASNHTLSFIQGPFDAPPVPESLNTHHGFVQSKARPTTLDTIVFPHDIPEPPPPVHSMIRPKRVAPLDSDPEDTVLDDVWFERKTASKQEHSPRKNSLFPFIFGIVLGTCLTMTVWAAAMTTVLNVL